MEKKAGIARQRLERRNSQSGGRVANPSRMRPVFRGTPTRHIAEDQRPFRIVYEIIKQQILDDRLPSGLVLLESRMAEILAVSRAPVRRALQLLHQDRLIHRFNGRGYLVGPAADGISVGDIKPLRIDLLEAGFQVPDGLSESIGLFTWERIYREIVGAVGRTIPFGTFRIVESAITERFKVSRTVTREVLGRLRDRGLIEKNRWSTWIAGPLTARTVDECFDVRIVLEPHALRAAFPNRDRAAIEAMRTQLVAAMESESLPRIEIDSLENDFNKLLFGASWNQRLLTVTEDCRMPTVIDQLFDEYFGPTDNRIAFSEHILIIEHLCRGAVDAAAAALAAHLEAARQRTKSRLKVLAIIPDPDTENYLERIH